MLQTGSGANNHIILSRRKPRKVDLFVESSTGHGGNSS